jgi:hypothetical protein
MNVLLIVTYGYRFFAQNFFVYSIPENKISEEEMKILEDINHHIIKCGPAPSYGWPEKVVSAHKIYIRLQTDWKNYDVTSNQEIWGHPVQFTKMFNFRFNEAGDFTTTYREPLSDV